MASSTSSRPSRARELAREIVERLRRLLLSAGPLGLLAHAAGEPAGEDCRGKEDHQREEFMRPGDREGVERLDEEEIVGEERQHRGDDRREPAADDAADDDRDEVEHRQVLQRQRRRRAPARRGSCVTVTAAGSRPLEPAGAPIGARQVRPAIGGSALDRRHDVHADVARAAQQRVGQRPPGQPRQQRPLAAGRRRSG